MGVDPTTGPTPEGYYEIIPLWGVTGTSELAGDPGELALLPVGFAGRPGGARPVTARRPSLVDLR